MADNKSRYVTYYNATRMLRAVVYGSDLRNRVGVVPCGAEYDCAGNLIDLRQCADSKHAVLRGTPGKSGLFFTRRRPPKHTGAGGTAHQLHALQACGIEHKPGADLALLQQRRCRNMAYKITGAHLALDKIDTWCESIFKTESNTGKVLLRNLVARLSPASVRSDQVLFYTKTAFAQALPVLAQQTAAAALPPPVAFQ